MIIARDLYIEAGARLLIAAASFSVHPGDKIGLVGKNGAGKTTLLRTLAGELEPAAGTIRRSGVIGYLSQEAALAQLADDEVNALERVLTARDIGNLERRMERVRRQMELTTGTERDRLIARFSRLDDEFTARGGYVAKGEAKRFAASVGIKGNDLFQQVATMSGGQRRRVELARVLFAETDVLILDEPTNHLDLDAKAWLMDFLATYSGGLLVVSHDLPLLDEGSSRIGATTATTSRSGTGAGSSGCASRSIRTRRSPGWRRVSGASRARRRRWPSGPAPGRPGWRS